MTAIEPSAPEPVDEHNHQQLQRVIADAALSPKPFGSERCASCLYYLEPDVGFAYCWQPTVRILVDADWWCQWWEEPAS